MTGSLILQIPGIKLALAISFKYLDLEPSINITSPIVAPDPPIHTNH